MLVGDMWDKFPGHVADYSERTGLQSKRLLPCGEQKGPCHTVGNVFCLSMQHGNSTSETVIQASAGMDLSQAKWKQQASECYSLMGGGRCQPMLNSSIQNSLS